MLTAAAWAEEPVEELFVVREPDVPAARVTEIDPRELPASADLATAAQRAPGVVVRRLGGLGDPVEIGLRGAAARHTEVLFDGIPLNPEGSASVDVSDLPVAALGRVEVWRGASPSSFGSPAIGGAIAVWTRRDPLAEGALSLGSFGTGRATVVAGQGAGLLVVDGLATGGGFRWYDDGGTTGTATDDRLRTRANNDHARLSTVGRADAGPVTLLHTAVLREEGVPGFVFDPTGSVRYGLHRHLVGATARGDLGDAAVLGRAYGLWRREWLRDPLAEIGLGSAGDTTTTLGSVGLDARLADAVSGRVRVEVSAGGRVDLAPGAGREMARAALGVPVDGRRLDLWPVVQVLGVTGATPLVLPRVGARWGPASATAGLSGRPPDLTELHGDRGAMVGNPDLRPERGMSADLGLERRGDARWALVAFASRIRDLVVWIPTPQGVAHPENIDDARILGLEASAALTGSTGELSANATWMDPRRVSTDPTYAGRRLPRIPVAEAFLLARADLAPAALSADLSVTSATFADAANLRPEPARVLVGATASADLSPHVRVALDARNLLGVTHALVARDPLVEDGLRAPRALQDFGGYPLPGRQLLATVTVGR